MVGAADSRCGDGDLGFGRGMGFAEADGAKGNEPKTGGKTSASGLSFARKTTTPIEACVGCRRFARFGRSAVQVEGLVAGVGRDALSGGGAGAYRVSGNAEHLEMGQGTDAGTLYRQVVAILQKLELIGGKRVA